MIDLDTVKDEHKRYCKDAYDIVEKKGADYNRKQQNSGDTLFNMRVSTLLGITNNTCQGVLVRLSDKFMRLNSLCANPLENPAIKDESVDDTIKDIINYVIYLGLFYKEERGKLEDAIQEVKDRGFTQAK